MVHIMKNTKNILFMLFLGLSSFTMLSCEMTKNKEELKYILSSNGEYYIVSDIGSVTSKDIVIPSSYNNTFCGV